MTTQSLASNQFRFAGRQLDGLNINWCTFIGEDNKEISVGLTSERMVGFKQKYSVDLQMVCRIALEQLEYTAGKPYFIDGRDLLRLDTALRKWEFRKPDLNKSTVRSSSIEHAIEGVANQLNRRHGEGWKYFYTEIYPPDAHRGDFTGSRFVFRRRVSGKIG